MIMYGVYAVLAIMAVLALVAGCYRLRLRPEATSARLVQGRGADQVWAIQFLARESLFSAKRRRTMSYTIGHKGVKRPEYIRGYGYRYERESFTEFVWADTGKSASGWDRLLAERAVRDEVHRKECADRVAMFATLVDKEREKIMKELTQ